MAESVVNLMLNGSPKTVGSRTVSELILELQLEGKKLAVELNKEIVARGKYSSTELKSGDSLEIVHFVGGG